ncbi:MAG: hypothetical protein KJN95_01000, partial [Gammaproteobacteria bacterium]|nr:hypothetical protein [Gammaproteobacteria bacterium]
MILNKSVQCGCLATVLLLSGCTSIPDDAGVSSVSDLIAERIDPAVQLPVTGGEPQFTREQITGMISAPLNLLDAERISVAVN